MTQLDLNGMKVLALNLRPNATRKIGNVRTIARGFSLVELLVVIVLASIMMAIAIPTYRSYVRDGQRGVARAALADAGARLDRHFFDNNRYTTNLTLVGYSANPVVTTEGMYSVAAAAGTTGSISTSFTLTATSVDTTRDPECATLTLTSQGQKGYSGTAASVDECW
ncbi:MAG: type IV pilus assembly protein PilE [Gammaproteobacteria bacterium]|jgi:type IV pilus assembly protein PilE